MSGGDIKQPERILIVDETASDRKEAGARLRSYFPAAQVSTADSLDKLRRSLAKEDFDIVILDHDLSQYADMVELLYTLKTENYEPSVVVVSKSNDSNAITDLYKFGCHRYITKDERWLDELGTAVDYLIRWRKARKENLSLRAKLTESNMLLAEKNRRLDEFSTTLAHDIRGPLGALIMRLEFLEDHYADAVDERFRDILSRACESTKRLTDLVQAMYEYAKLGSKASKMSALSLEQLVDEVIHDLNVREELDIEIKLDKLPTVWGNADLLRRIFINLINNAIKYNDKEKIVIEIKVGKAIDRVLAPYCEIIVQDNGAGIAKEDLKDLFAIFIRGDSAEKYGSGAGIGLAVVKRIIDLHYGDISVDSQVGGGTRFTLTLPLDKIDLGE